MSLFTAETEQAVITGVLDLRAEMDTASQVTSLEPEAFSVPAHRVIWAAFQQITQVGNLIDSWTLTKTMKALGASDADHQMADRYFNDSRNGLGTLDIRARISKVADTYRRRVIAKTMNTLSEAAEGSSWADLESALGDMVGKVAAAGNHRFREVADHSRQIESFLSGKAIYPPESRENLVRFDIPSLDSSIMANPGRLIVIGGLPSAGKTAFALQAAIKTSQVGKRVAFGSLEMDEDEIAARVIAEVAGVNSIHVLRHDSVPRPELRPQFDAIRRNLVGLYGCAGDSWTAIEAAIVREHRRAPLSVAIIDYLQLLEAPDILKKRNDNEAQRIGEITKSCKRLAQKLGINVVLLSQFNREVGEGQEPTLQNFLGSGQIERDADIALILWNDTAQMEPRAIRTIHCRIAKNRGGDRYGKVTMQFSPAFNRFEEGQGMESNPVTLPDAYGKKRARV